MPRRVVVVVLLSLLARPAPAADWPRFRGPDGSGISTEKGLPQTWSHVEDELPDSLRGPAENMTILVTGYSEAGPPVAGSNLGKYQGTLRHEPLAMALTYHKGRVAQLPMAHSAQQWLAVDNIVLFQRAAQWCATGKVTMLVPQDFPTLGAARTRGEVPSTATLMQTATTAAK